MSTFRKYGFHNPTEWEAAKALITTTDEEGNESYTDAVVMVVELGNLCETWGEDEEGNPICEVQSPLYSVDVLWRDEPLADWDSALVFPKPVGVHTFGSKHAAEYARTYCEMFPDSDYCNPPAPEELV
jgi:hypothetical protein